MSKDPYLDFLNTDSLLFGSSSKTSRDPLKFSDPLSFGTSDPLSFGANDPLSFSVGGSDKKSDKDKKKDKEEIDVGDAESHHSDDEASAPPIDYLGYIQVQSALIELSN